MPIIYLFSSVKTSRLYRSGTVPCDVAMVQVSPVDKHGYVSLGTSVDATLAGHRVR